MHEPDIAKAKKLLAEAGYPEGWNMSKWCNKEFDQLNEGLVLHN